MSEEQKPQDSLQQQESCMAAVGLRIELVIQEWVVGHQIQPVGPPSRITRAHDGAQCLHSSEPTPANPDSHSCTQTQTAWLKPCRCKQLYTPNSKLGVRRRQSKLVRRKGAQVLPSNVLRPTLWAVPCKRFLHSQRLKKYSCRTGTTRG